MKKLIVPFLFCLMALCGHSQTPVSFVYFSTNESKLSAEAIAGLDALVKNVNSFCTVIINGHTDNTGSLQLNERLSLDRANEVAHYLKTKGIKKQQVSISAYDFSKPVSDNSTEKGKALNRRVEITLTCQGELEETVVQPVSTTTTAVEHVTKGHESTIIRKPAQVFKANADKEIKITGVEGTVIIIPSNTLETADHKKAKGEITIKLEEYYKVSDMIQAGLTTMSGKNILESSGMVYIVADKDGQKLDVATDGSITVKIKGDDKKDENFIFNMEEQCASETTAVELTKGYIYATKDTIGVDYMGYTYDDLDVLDIRGDSCVRADWKLSPLVTGIKDKKIKRTGSEKRSKWSPSVTDWGLANKWMQKSVKMGWINCDRFYYSNKNLVSFTVEVSDTLNMLDVYLVFKDMKSIMPSVYNGAKRVFNGVPEGKEVSVVAIGRTNKSIMYARQDVEIRGGKKLKMDALRMTKDELKAELEKLN